MQRPESVTVTCWVIIAIALEGITGILSGIAEASLRAMLQPMHSHVSYSSAVSVGTGVLVITIYLASMMLRGANWARILYLVLMTLLSLALLINLSSVAAGVLITALAKQFVFGALLLRPTANQFFNPHQSGTLSDAAA